MDKASIRKLHCCRFVRVIYGCNHVTSTGEILEDKCVVGERACITVGEDDHRVRAICDGSIQATVGPDRWKREAHELRKIAPDRGRRIFRRLAGLSERTWIPEPYHQLPFTSIFQERIVA